MQSSCYSRAELTAQLVNKGFATTGSQEERVIEVDSDHRDLCNVADPLLTNFITEVLEDARLRIGSDSPLCKYICCLEIPSTYAFR